MIQSLIAVAILVAIFAVLVLLVGAVVMAFGLASGSIFTSIGILIRDHLGKNRRARRRQRAAEPVEIAGPVNADITAGSDLPKHEDDLHRGDDQQRDDDPMALLPLSRPEREHVTRARAGDGPTVPRQATSSSSAPRDASRSVPRDASRSVPRDASRSVPRDASADAHEGSPHALHDR